MKKLLGIVVLGLLLFTLTGCDDPGTKTRKAVCQNYVDKKSDKFKDCIKSADHSFVYGLEKAIENEKKNIIQYNKSADLVNSIKINVDRSEYEEVEFRSFLDDNFEDTLLLIGLKNDNVLSKKIKFKSGFYLGLSDDKTISLNKKDPNDYNNSLWFVSANFHNVEIQSKILKPYENFIFYLDQSAGTDSMIYGIFYKKPGIGIERTDFYIQDIEMKKRKFDREQIIDQLIEEHVYMYGSDNDPEKQSKNEIRSNVRSLIKSIFN